MATVIWNSSAEFDPTKRYRYLLRRSYRGFGVGPTLLWIMCNPSTANGIADDPTILRCKGFTYALGFSEMVVCNLYAYCATDPRALWAARNAGIDIVGSDNDKYLLATAAKADQIIAAWGAQPQETRVIEVRKLLEHRTLHCLEETKAGRPKHPLYLKQDLLPVPWGPKVS